MRLFGTFKSIEVYLIVSAIFLLFTFDQLCEKKEEKMWMGYSITKESDHLKPIVYPTSAEKNAEVAALVQLDDNATAPHVHESHGDNNDTASNNTVIIVSPADLAAASKNNDDKPMVATTPATLILPVTRAARVESVKASTNDLEKYNLPTDPPTIETFPEKIPEQIHVSTAAPPVEIVKVPAVDVPILVPSPEVREEPKVVLRPVVTPPATFVAASRDNRIEMVKVPVTESAAKQDEPGIFGQLLGIFGGSGSSNARVKREAVISADGKTQVVENQTHFDVYRCKCLKAGSILKHMNPFNNKNVIQQMFAWRFWGILLLTIHLVLVLYHSIVNCMHRVPTSHRFNRVFAFVGLIIWDLITLWVIYQWLMWNNKFLHQISPIFPSVPSEFYAFLVLSFAMNIILLYEFVTPMTFFLSYDITPRHPRRGYIPAAQSENEYISGIIRQLEAAPQQPIESPKSRPLIRSSESNMV